MHAGKLRFTMQVQDNVTCSFGQIMHNSNCARYLDDQPLCPDALTMKGVMKKQN